MHSEAVSAPQLVTGCLLIAGGVVLYFTMANFLTTVGATLAGLLGLVLVAFQLSKLR